MIKFASIEASEVTVQRSGVKTGGDKSPILRATVSKNRFRINYLMADKLGVVSGDDVIFLIYPSEGTKSLIIMKNEAGLERSGKLHGKSKEGIRQNLDFTYSGVYTTAFDEAAKVLDFDPNDRVEISYKVVDEGIGNQFNTDDIDYGDVPMLLLAPASFTERATRDSSDLEEDVEVEVED